MATRLITPPLVVALIQDAVLLYLEEKIPAPMTWLQFEVMMLNVMTKREFDRMMEMDKLDNELTQLLLWLHQDELTKDWFRQSPIGQLLGEDWLSEPLAS